MTSEAGVTLQINLAPADLPTATHTLPHQLRQWATQVDEILLTVDLHKSRGRYAEAWAERLPGLRRVIRDCCAQYAHARSVDVDYSEGTVAHLSSTYFGGGPFPVKDWNGGPFYSYFFGLDTAHHDYVFHMDSDIMYGGGSQSWVREATQLLAGRPEVLSCSPLPGPPTADGELRSQTLEREPFTSLAYRASGLSTRLFLMDRARLRARIVPLTPGQPPRVRIWQALADGNPPYDPAELMISQAMARRGMIRVDFLGAAPGVWAVHPPYRSPLFYTQLPTLIERIEGGDIPEGQRGDHDINGSLVDWTSARQSRWQRVAKHARLAARRFVPG